MLGRSKVLVLEHSVGECRDVESGINMGGIAENCRGDEIESDGTLVGGVVVYATQKRCNELPSLPWAKLADSNDAEGDQHRQVMKEDL